MDNGLLSDTAKQIYKPAESVSFTCNTGYKPKSGETTCLPTTAWSPPPVCNIVNCEVPVLNNGQYLTEVGVSAGKTNYPYGTTIYVRCNHGYDISNGTYSRTCHEDGTWGPSNAQCVKMFCNDNKVGLNNSSIYRYPVLGLGERGNIAYNRTYFALTEGSLTITCTENRTFRWTSQPHFGRFRIYLQ